MGTCDAANTVLQASAVAGTVSGSCPSSLPIMTEIPARKHTIASTNHLHQVCGAALLRLSTAVADADQQQATPQELT
jgi:hypothetical protein